jgi:hypothetical protein
VRGRYANHFETVVIIYALLFMEWDERGGTPLEDVRRSPLPSGLSLGCMANTESVATHIRLWSTQGCIFCSTAFIFHAAV